MITNEPKVGDVYYDVAKKEIYLIINDYYNDNSIYRYYSTIVSLSKLSVRNVAHTHYFIKQYLFKL